MLDFFSIFSKGGILLWCFKDLNLLPKEWEAFTPTVNNLIKSVLLQERATSDRYWENGQLALKYKLDNEFELVFVVAYQKMLPLSYLDKLLDEIQKKFRDMFEENLIAGSFINDYSDFDNTFKKTLKEVEDESRMEKAKPQKPRDFSETEKAHSSVASMIIKHKDDNENVNVKPTKKASVPAGAPRSPEPDQGLDQATIIENRKNFMSKTPKSKKSVKSPKAGKEKTTWDPVTMGGKVKNAKDLEYTTDKPTADGEQPDNNMNQYVPDARVVGFSGTLKDVEISSGEDDDDDDDDDTPGKPKSSGSLLSMFKGLVGSKALTREDLEPVVSKLRDNLVAKNVASEVALSLCESVSSKLEGSVMGTFQSVQRTVRDTLTESLLKLLTPKRRIDIIRDVMEAKANSRPYVMTFCGVNGVGKSTNLAKICFWLIENKCRVLIAACDTFRAGAVEQLRTHTRRLNNLHPASENGGKPMVHLYEKGYGKDAAGIAMEAINYARDIKVDVVLVDTAGRMQDNEPLMRALSKLISVNAPDLVLFVGEALVGNEAIDQLVKFNAALEDHSSQENPHTIDGIVLTKFDTIDDKVGSAISMTYISGQPIVFVGTGQTYTDLKSLNAKAVISALMK